MTRHPPFNPTQDQRPALMLASFLVPWGIGLFALIAFAWFFHTQPDARFAGNLPSIYLGLAVLLLLFPFIKKFKFGDLLEVERATRAAVAEAAHARTEAEACRRELVTALHAAAEARREAADAQQAVKDWTDALRARLATVQAQLRAEPVGASDLEATLAVGPAGPRDAPAAPPDEPQAGERSP